MVEGEEGGGGGGANKGSVARGWWGLVDHGWGGMWSKEAYSCCTRYLSYERHLVIVLPSFYHMHSPTTARQAHSGPSQER